MGNINWATVTAFSIGLLTLAGIVVPMLLKVVNDTQAQWAQLHAHTRQLNGGMDARIQAAVRAALDAALAGKSSTVAAAAAGNASHDVRETQGGPGEANGEPGAQ